MAKVIGILVSVFPAVEYGSLHYRNLELQKIDQLKNGKGNYNSKMRITNSMKTGLRWWLENIQYQYRNIYHGTSEMVTTTDASLEGWDAVYNDSKIGGKWNETERVHHINYLELLAVFHAIKSFCKNHKNTYVGLSINNACAIAYINNMGGIKSVECNSLAYDIWSWCIDRDIWVSANYVHTSENIADVESRKFNDNIEWMFNENIFKLLIEIWGTPDIDLFATRLNTQLSTYSSWKPDPGCKFIDAFTVSWSSLFSSIFAPFSLLGRVVQKLRRDRAESRVIAPIWPTQSWYADLLH